MKRSLFSKIFTTQIVVALTAIIIIIPMIFLLIGEYFVSTQKDDILQDAQRVAILTEQLARVGRDDTTWEFFRSGIEFAGRQSTVLVVGRDGKIVAAPRKISGVNLEEINEDFIKPVKEGHSVIRLYSKGSIFSEQTIVAMVPIFDMEVIAGEESFIGAAIALRPMPVVRTVQRRIVTIIIMALTVAWIVALIVSVTLTRQITKPVKKMRNAAQKIASGNFEERIPITSKDEIGQLAESFNSMTKSLNELENMRSTFISDVSHELRTPMTIISGFVEGVLDGTIAREEQEKYLGIVLSEIKRLSRLVSDLLESSRFEQGKVILNKTNVDLNRLSAESIISYEQSLTEKNISVNLSLDEEECFAFCDKDSIKRVLINLIDNAIKFTPDGGEISVSTKKENKKVFVSIQNSGEGISEEDLRHIWERFYKTDKSRANDKKGVGLGLHIVKTIISQHGGEIYAESEEGKFARFTFVLDEGMKQ